MSRLARSTQQVLEIGWESIEQGFIISRTKEALAKRKAEGMKQGRPVGASKNLKLDKHVDKIDAWRRGSIKWPFQASGRFTEHAL